MKIVGLEIRKTIGRNTAVRRHCYLPFRRSIEVNRVIEYHIDDDLHSFRMSRISHGLVLGLVPKGAIDNRKIDGLIPLPPPMQLVDALFGRRHMDVAVP